MNSRKITYRVEPSPKELQAEMIEFANELRRDKQKALIFFQRTGILDEHGNLTEPYRVLDIVIPISTL